MCKCINVKQDGAEKCAQQTLSGLLDKCKKMFFKHNVLRCKIQHNYACNYANVIS